MTIQTKTVYVPTYKSSNLKVGTLTKDFYEDFQSHDTVESKELITFTTEEYNEHIKEIIEAALENAKNNLRQATGTFNSDFFSQQLSITNNFEETFNKYKL